MSEPRTVVVGASSGLGRCIAIGLAERGGRVAMLARREERLASAVEQAGTGSVAVRCDVTDPGSIEAAVARAADELGGIDAVVYTPGIGSVVPLRDTDAATWAQAFATNVTGASLVTAAALPHLQASQGSAVYLSSVSASETPPWPGLGPYVVSKAALDKLIDAWRNEHPEIGFTRVVVGECGGGDDEESMSGFASDWDPDVTAEYGMTWVTRNYMTGALMDVRNLVDTVDLIVRSDATVCHRSVTVAPRLVQPG